MNDKPTKSGASIIREVTEQLRRENHVPDDGSGMTYHFVEEARTFGPGREIEGVILVEDQAGRIGRISGQQLTELHKKNPWIAKKRRLRSEN